VLIANRSLTPKKVEMGNEYSFENVGAFLNGKKIGDFYAYAIIMQGGNSQSIIHVY
jgi:hypothetical protein